MKSSESRHQDFLNFKLLVGSFIEVIYYNYIPTHTSVQEIAYT